MPSQQVLPEHLEPKKGRLYKLIQKSQINIYMSQNAGLPGACQPSRWAVTLVDVHALGAPLGAWKEGNSNQPLNPSCGQWLSYRGCDMEKTPLSLPLQHTYLKAVGLNLVSGKTIWHEIRFLA